MAILKNLIKKIYPASYLDVYAKVEELIKDKKDTSIEKDWYKDMNLYVTYPDAFCSDNSNNLNTLAEKVSYIKKLGCNAIHVLPFFNSPMIDMGFDVSDYKKVRKELGGNKSFDKLIEVCNKNKIHLFVDIVLNHISYKHKWFQKAIIGDPFYKDFFIYKKKKPNLIEVYTKLGRTFAKYRINNKAHNVFIIFPDQVGSIPHWHKAKDHNWYYHTFYPHQIDLNWQNPNVFIEFAKILIYWAQKGLNFRLDAIPFLGKDIEKGKYTDDEFTHHVVQALHQIVKTVSKQSVFLAEVAFELEKIKTYFGTNGVVESELNYNFELNAYLWLSILERNANYIYKVLKRSKTNLPYWACWVNFLRNHDALMVDRIEENQRKKIFRKLKGCGLPFAKGTNITGRTFSFLKENSNHLVAVYLMLASLPGVPAIIYGDETAKKNDLEYMKKMTKKKALLTKENVCNDTRDINRGVITDKELNQGRTVYIKLSSILNKRLKYAKQFRSFPKQIDSPREVLSLKYHNLECHVNLSDKTIGLAWNDQKNLVLNINNADLAGQKLQLKPLGGVWATT